jgi:6-phosphofructokinase 1
MPASKDTVSSAAVVVVAMAASATITFVLTRRAEYNKQLKEKKEQYDRDLMIKNKTLEARKLTGEPAGKVVDSLTIDKVYLWEIEDLRKRFNSSKVPNVMKNMPQPIKPTLAPETSTSDSKHGGVHSDATPTNFNKLITNHECILGEIVRKPNMQTHTHAFIRAGPRRYLHFDPNNVSAAIVTCGGLCPGLNNVIREITNTLFKLYGIGGSVYGIQGGYHGFFDFERYPPIMLTPELVHGIHHEGGTVLGSSRGGFDLDKILEFLETKKISQLYVIGEYRMYIPFW